MSTPGAVRESVALFIAIALTASAAGGQETRSSEGAAALAGSWALASERDVIEDAIERGTSDMNFMTRPIARRRLRATNSPYRTIDIVVDAEAVATAFDGREPIRTPLSGSAVRWQREDGEMLNVSTTTANGGVVQTFVAEDGSRENAFALSPEGNTLTMTVTIRSDGLPRPIVYRLAYRRSS